MIVCLRFILSFVAAKVLNVFNNRKKRKKKMHFTCFFFSNTPFADKMLVLLGVFRQCAFVCCQILL